MKKIALLLILLAPKVFAVADLVAPFTVDVISSKYPLWDTIEVTTYLSNIGTTPTIVKTSSFQSVSIGMDSLVPLRSHNFPAGTYLPAGGLVVYKDTIISFLGAFAIVSQADPIHVFQEYSIGNDVRAQAYNFYPKVLIDTIILVDTIRTHDTLKVAVHDTVKVTVRDTVTKIDTIKYCPPTLAKAFYVVARPPVSSVVYNVTGAPVWSGALPIGEYPHELLKPGAYLLVQAGQAHRFRIAYR